MWPNFEDIPCGFVDEKCVDEDFVFIMQELRDCFQFLHNINKILLYFTSLHSMYYHSAMYGIKVTAVCARVTHIRLHKMMEQWRGNHIILSLLVNPV
jgi:hypothetical protein